MAPDVFETFTWSLKIIFDWLYEVSNVHGIPKTMVRLCMMVRLVYLSLQTSVRESQQILLKNWTDGKEKSMTKTIKLAINSSHHLLRLARVRRLSYVKPITWTKLGPTMILALSKFLAPPSGQKYFLLSKDQTEIQCNFECMNITVRFLEYLFQ